MRETIAIVLGSLGAVAPVASLGSNVTIVDIVLGGGIWFAIGFGIGALIEKIRGRSAATPTTKTGS